MFKYKKVLYIVLSFIVLLNVTVYNPMIAYAAYYPSTWDRYINFPGIDENIYTAEQSIMDKYDSSYTKVPTGSDSGHGEAYEYTGLTIDIPTRTMSKWYTSIYGPFLDYASKSSSVESVSIQFNAENSTYNNANYAYVASDQENLADAKSVAALNSSTTEPKPLLINSDYESLSGTIIDTLNTKQTKNIIVVGGSQRFSKLFEIGGNFNIVRIGGQERNETYSLLKQCESNSSKIYNISSSPSLDSDGILFDIQCSNFDNKYKDAIESNLLNGNFEAARNIVLSTDHGSPDNVTTGDYAVKIGCKDKNSGKTKYLITYYVKCVDGFQYGVYQYIGEDYFSAPAPDSLPPVAKIIAPSTIAAGDTCTIDGSESHDQDVDGYIDGYYWDFDQPQYVDGEDYSSSYCSYFEPWFRWSQNLKDSNTQYYTERVHLVVADNDGLKAGTYKTIKVTPPMPTAKLNVTGTLKENRKISIDCTGSAGTKYYPITSYNITINAISGGDNSSIKYDGELNTTTKDLLIKKQGTYRVTLTVKNEFGYVATTYKDIVIQPDLPPISDANMVSDIFRDPNDGIYGTFVITDNSSSPDNDIISKRVWIYCYDSNNDHDFTDETYYVYQNGQWTLLGDYNAVNNIDISKVNSGNEIQVKLRSNQVGNYLFKLIVQESFGQPTIDKFITPSDYRISVDK